MSHPKYRVTDAARRAIVAAHDEAASSHGRVSLAAGSLPNEATFDQLRGVTSLSASAESTAMEAHDQTAGIVKRIIEAGPIVEPPPPPPEPEPEYVPWVRNLPPWARARHSMLLARMSGNATASVPSEVVYAEDVPQALRNAYENASPGTDIVITVRSGNLEGLNFGTSWNSDVTSRIFDGGRNIVLVAEQEPSRRVVAASREGKGDHDLALNAPTVTVDPRRSISGGDTVSVSGEHDGTGKLWLIGFDVKLAGRAAIFTHPNAGFQLGLLSSHVSISEIAREQGSDLKWGMQLYNTSHVFQDVSADISGSREHVVYDHGHKSGKPSIWSRTVFVDSGGQPYQGTERPKDGVGGAGAPDVFLVDNSIWTGYHQSVGRAGSALTLAGSNRSFVMLDSLVYDDNPNDTPGAPNKNYGAAVVWCPDGLDESYRDMNGERANCSTILRSSSFAARNSARSLCEFNNAHELVLSGAQFKIAGSGNSPSINRDVSDGYRSKRTTRTLMTGGEVSSYVDAEFSRLTRGRANDYQEQNLRTADVDGRTINPRNQTTYYFNDDGSRAPSRVPLQGSRRVHLEVFRHEFLVGVNDFGEALEAVFAVQADSPLAGGERRAR